MMAATVTPSSCSIVVQQLALGCQEPELKSLFSPFGRIVSIEVYSEGHDVQEDSIFAGTKRRSAEIVFAVANTAWVAYEQLNGTLFMNEPLRLTPPQPTLTVDDSNSLYNDTGFGALPGQNIGDNQPSSSLFGRHTHTTPMAQMDGWTGQSFQPRGHQPPANSTTSQYMMRSHHAHSDVSAGGLNIGFGVEGSAGAWTDQEDPLANMGFQLPTLDDVLRRGNMVQSFHSAQLLVSFKTKQGDKVVSTSLLRNLFSVVGPVVDVQIKHNEYDPYYGVQHGYGFLHFSKSWLGIQHALLTPNIFKHRSINGILFDCNLSYQLLQFLNILKAQYRIDLVSYYAHNGPGASVVANLIARISSRLESFGSQFQSAAGARDTSLYAGQLHAGQAFQHERDIMGGRGRSGNHFHGTAYSSQQNAYRSHDHASRNAGGYAHPMQTNRYGQFDPNKPTALLNGGYASSSVNLHHLPSNLGPLPPNPPHQSLHMGNRSAYSSSQYSGNGYFDPRLMGGGGGGGIPSDGSSGMALPSDLSYLASQPAPQPPVFHPPYGVNRGDRVNNEERFPYLQSFGTDHFPADGYPRGGDKVVMEVMPAEAMSSRLENQFAALNMDGLPPTSSFPLSAEAPAFVTLSSNPGPEASNASTHHRQLFAAVVDRGHSIDDIIDATDAVALDGKDL